MLTLVRADKAPRASDGGLQGGMDHNDKDVIVLLAAFRGRPSRAQRLSAYVRTPPVAPPPPWYRGLLL
jgi:hypothetical protein